MARVAAAAVLFAVVCCLLVAPAPARRPVELPPQVVPDAVDREAAAEPLLPKPVAGAEAADRTTTAVAVPEEGPAGQRSSLLCRFFWCDREEPPSTLDEWAQPAGAEMEGNGEKRPCDSDSDDSDSDSDSDSDDEGGIAGWFWSLAHRF